MVKWISFWFWLSGITAILCAVLSFGGCAPKMRTHFLKAEEIQRLPSEFETTATDNRLQLRGRGPCYNYGSYVPDTTHLDHTPVKYIRVNFHWMQPLDAVVDFPEEKVEEFSRGLLMACNYAMANNKAMWLPHNNDTPTLPIRIQYELTPLPEDADDDGIYFHYDDDLYYYVAKGKDRNLYEREVIKKYGTQLDSVLNFFFMPHHPDSVASKTYLAVGTGVALGNAIKLAGVNYEGDFWPYRGVFNHEVGHIFGLNHTWAYNDGCDDTPRHKQNCWNRGQPGCDTTTSNNVMDYNAMQLAWTPCQIGKMHQRMADTRANARKLLSPRWCTLDDTQTLVIRDTVHWTGARDLEGNLEIAPGAQLTIGCRVSLPPGGKISVQPGGLLILDGATLHNACGREWQGIEIQELEDLKGIVRYQQEPTIENVLNEIKDTLE
ncbi:M43 family zinc metalloprotease [Flavilitoribacter nigricans]|uniref:Peptidase M43 pregnancy-associated plasma-A domain-containing protein n=1 Tax=Flavilitoribacter nigricans (strain ATCC 23147 / DSM 23189 / NBRC 102662 / NCIMB 1420 / SS-2) TaxID=1122177 RepID=A0A2D0N7V4_FLAN2|nr:M43 family zinc metalloprotease [Flavilitoribacter nigricans]PHN04478.1 hypothetical protein CRP01_20940 [Flavilitoribacter nigricans DSM 23189 = NBRC 102662]